MIETNVRSSLFNQLYEQISKDFALVLGLCSLPLQFTVVIVPCKWSEKVPTGCLQRPEDRRGFPYLFHAEACFHFSDVILCSTSFSCEELLSVFD
jgi:hypothetical protein